MKPTKNFITMYNVFFVDETGKLKDRFYKDKITFLVRKDGKSIDFRCKAMKQVWKDRPNGRYILSGIVSIGDQVKLGKS